MSKIFYTSSMLNYDLFVFVRPIILNTYFGSSLNFNKLLLFVLFFDMFIKYSIFAVYVIIIYGSLIRYVCPRLNRDSI